MDKKRKKKPKKIPDFPAEVRERHERTQRMLAERIAYHEARIAAGSVAKARTPRLRNQAVSSLRST